jgi:hypothetical protein
MWGWDSDLLDMAWKSLRWLEMGRMGGDLGE